MAVYFLYFLLDNSIPLGYNRRIMKIKQYVLYAKAGTLQKTRKKIAEGSESWLKVGVMHDRIDPRKVGIVSKDFWENVLHCR